MSGFVGILNFDNAPVDRSFLESLTGYLSCCGPDRQDIWIDGRVGFGHALLRSTFESAKEQQPCSLDGQVWISADARIDGRAELIPKLNSKARPVKLDAPAPELILHAYEVWGEECLQHLIGDFAFALWDGRRRRLFCARDQFGVVPFYYAEVNGGLIFSNVLNCLRLHPAISDQLNEQAIGDFLLFNMNMSTSTTTFADIQSLPPAHTLICADRAVRIQRYWDLPETGDYVRFKKPEEYVEQFRELFEQAVGDRLRTDSAGVHLSGGMDSTSITVTAHKLLKERGRKFDLRAYNICYEWLIEEEEGRYADEVARHINIPIEHLVAEEFVTRSPETTPDWVSPEPFLITSQTPEQEIAKRVASFSRVLLAGFGGDPLFAYSHSPFDSTLRDKFGRRMARELWLTLFVHNRMPRWGLRTELRKRLGKTPPSPTLPDWVNPDFAGRVDLLGRWQQIIAEQQSQIGQGKMHSAFWVNLFTWAHPGFNGLHLRFLFPFFDLRLMSYVSKTPTMPWREHKRLLREAMVDRLPEAVRQRPKTPLYVYREQNSALSPWHRLSLQPENQKWRRDLINTREMGPFIDVERALAAIESPVPTNTHANLTSCLPLAFWLLYRRRPQVDASQTRGVSYGPDI